MGKNFKYTKKKPGTEQCMPFSTCVYVYVILIHTDMHSLSMVVQTINW